MFTDINHVKLIMLLNYENQLDNIFNKFHKGEVHTLDLINHINFLSKRCSYTRIDIKNYGNNTNIQFLEYGKNISMTKPDWFKDELGQGSKLEWNHQNTQFIFKCINEGTLKIFLRGIDFRDINDQRVPIYTNFTKLKINSEVVFEDNCLIWHDSPYVFEKNCNDQQYYQIELEFKTLFDYFPHLNYQMIITDDINNSYKKIKKQIHLEKLLLKSTM